MLVMGIEYWVELPLSGAFTFDTALIGTLSSPAPSASRAPTLKANCPCSLVQASKVVRPSHTRSIETRSAGGEPSSSITLPEKTTIRSGLFSICGPPGEYPAICWPRKLIAPAIRIAASNQLRHPISASGVNRLCAFRRADASSAKGRKRGVSLRATMQERDSLDPTAARGAPFCASYAMVRRIGAGARRLPG